MSGGRSAAAVCRLASLAVALVVSTSMEVRQASGDSAAAPECEVKAAFLANFAKFVEWPPTRVPWPGAPYLIAVLGGDPLGACIQGAAAGKLIAGHPLEVRQVATAKDARVAHVVFIGGAERGRLPAILREVHPAGVLTVGDSDGYANAGVILNLFVEAQRVKFEVNRSAAGQAGLRLSSQILTIGRPVPGGGV